MQIAALSAIPAPMNKNSQKGVKKLLMAAAADEEGLQRCDVSILILDVSKQTLCQAPRLH